MRRSSRPMRAAQCWHQRQLQTERRVRQRSAAALESDGEVACAGEKYLQI